jgi:hypothetical protein
VGLLLDWITGWDQCPWLGDKSIDGVDMALLLGER